MANYREGMFEDYRQPGKKRIRLYLSLWAMLVLTSALKRRGENLGTLETLKTSHFARVMVMDV